MAPLSVEFFSVKGYRLGSKRLLTQERHDITGISVEALRGCRLDRLNVDERMAWFGQRQTKRTEDMAYSLLGIFNVYLPLIYGEGRENAFARLWREISASQGQEHSTPSQGRVLQGQSQTIHSYNGPVFNGPIAGRHAVPGPYVTGGTVNLQFR